MTEAKTILITGACGFVGRNLVNYLLNHRLFDKVIVCCRNKNTAVNFFKPMDGLIVSEADLTMPSTYQTIFKTYLPTNIIHLAAISRFNQGEDDPEATLKINFFGTNELLKLSVEYKTKKFLIVSSNLARNPKGVTGVSKYLTEALVKTFRFGSEVFLIRLPNVIDSPGAVTLLFKKQVEKGLPITITDRRMSRKFESPLAVCKDLLFVLSHGHHGDIYVNNKPSTFIVDLAKKMIEQSGKNIPIRFIGMRPGEKLQEEDYPPYTIEPTTDNNIFRLIENQHSLENIEAAIGLLKEKVSEETINKIRTTLNIK